MKAKLLRKIRKRFEVLVNTGKLVRPNERLTVFDHIDKRVYSYGSIAEFVYYTTYLMGHIFIAMDWFCKTKRDRKNRLKYYDKRNETRMDKLSK